jgi:hypothetical protein
MILVTRNKVDHEAIYELRDCHPGVVFFVTKHNKLNKLEYQIRMMNAALDEIEDDEPIQEAIIVTISGRPGHQTQITIEREELPKILDFPKGSAA